jgi:hypothetical protein
VPRLEGPVRMSAATHTISNAALASQLDIILDLVHASHAFTLEHTVVFHALLLARASAEPLPAVTGACRPPCACTGMSATSAELAACAVEPAARHALTI